MVRITQVVLGTLGVALLVGAWLMHADTNRFLRASRIAEATVIALPHGPLHPTIRFVDAGGKTIEYQENGGDPVQIGQRVRVRYLAEDPKGTARLGGSGVGGTERRLGLLGALLLIGAVTGPILVKRFPGVVGVRGAR